MMDGTTVQIDKMILLENKSDSLCRSMGRLVFDIESMKRIRDSEKEINELRRVYFELLQEYREIQNQVASGR